MFLGANFAYVLKFHDLMTELSSFPLLDRDDHSYQQRLLGSSKKGRIYCDMAEALEQYLLSEP